VKRLDLESDELRTLRSLVDLAIGEGSEDAALFRVGAKLREAQGSPDVRIEGPIRPAYAD
jgi:hypothetical protein